MKALIDIIFLSGISGAGKSFLIASAVAELSWLVEAKSVTTRPARSNVDESTSRVFVSHQEFFEMEARGELIFVNTVFGEYYAYRKAEISKFIEKKKTMLVDMKLNRVAEARQQYPNSICIYVRLSLPDSHTELQQERNNKDIRQAEAEIENMLIIDSNAYCGIIDAFFDNHQDSNSKSSFAALIQACCNSEVVE